MTQIPAGLLEQITGQSSVRFECPPSDKREESRISLSFYVDIVPVQNGRLAPAIHARLRDISSTGIAVICSQKMRPTDSFLITLPRKEQAPIWIVCQVARCKSVAEGLHIIGAEFVGYRQCQASETINTPLAVTL